jgi:hypothetical protein
MQASKSDHETLEHVEEVGFYSVIGMIVVAVLGLAGILAVSIKALSGFAALLAGL